MIGSIKGSNFWTRLTRWEYWPFNLVYFPVSFYWIWLSIKARSFFFFSAANPGIEYGGMLGESKFKIHAILPPELTPITFLVNPEAEILQIIEEMNRHDLEYPIIVKPDIGERGWMVERIHNQIELNAYLEQIQVPFLIQEYIHDSLELGVFYYRYPDIETGEISSIVGKEMLKVVGDGVSSVRELMKRDFRANLQLKVFEIKNPDILNKTPEIDEVLELMPIGNHIRGTTFLNFNHLIKPALVTVFDKISNQIEGFYFGRFDIRCSSEENLYHGNFKILELNGAGSEPGHIYHPGASLIKGYKSIVSHLNTLYRISRANRKRGHKFMSFGDGLKFLKHIRYQNKLRKNTVV